MQSLPQLNKRALTYLRIGDNPRALATAEALWVEAWQRIAVAIWKQCVPAGEFFSLFHVSAGSSQAVRRLLRDSQNVWMFAATTRAKHNLVVVAPLTLLDRRMGQISVRLSRFFEGIPAEYFRGYSV